MGKRKNAELRKPEILEHFYQVIIERGIEGASIMKIANSMNIHPSLIFHYYRTKEELLIDLTDYIEKKYDPPFIKDHFVTIKDPQQRYDIFFDIMFSEANIETVNTKAFYAFYYLSYRKPKIYGRFANMFKKHRDFIMQELEFFKSEGLIKEDLNLKLAAEFIVSVFEGLSFNSFFLAEGNVFEVYGNFCKKIVKEFLQKQDV